MNKPVITLTSDFADKFAESQVELVIHSINPTIKFIVGQSNVTPFSILEGAFILSKLYPFSPNGSIHLAVVDPGVGSERKGIIIKTKNYWFIGPDNGLLYSAATDNGIEKVWTINEAVIGSLSNTFHGRDIFAKVAAYISIDKPLEEFAIEFPVKDIVALSSKQNQVVHIDPYGNIKLQAKSNGFRFGDKLVIATPKTKTNAVYCKTFADVPLGDYLIYQGSHQTLELAKNQDSAAEKLDVKVGEILEIRKI